MNYQELYDAFIKSYNKAEVSPSQVGEVLARIAAMFPNYNNIMVQKERAFAIVRKTTVEGTDELSGKAISSAKADTVADASNEAFEFKKARADVTNIEMLIGSLKFLQKSLEVEYVNAGLN